MAATQVETDAMYNLGLAGLKGSLLIPQEEAAEWMRMAAQRNNEKALSFVAGAKE